MSPNRSTTDWPLQINGPQLIYAPSTLRPSPLLDQKEVTELKRFPAPSYVREISSFLIEGAKIETSLRGRGDGNFSKISWESAWSKMKGALQAGQLSPKTEKIYLNWVNRFRHYLEGKAAQVVRSEDARRFLTQLAVGQEVTGATQRQAFNALLFFYRHGLNLALDRMEFKKPVAQNSGLPVVFSQREITKIFQNLSGPLRLQAQLLYGCGLKYSEVLSLRAKDIDLEAMELRVLRVRGPKSRVVAIPANLKADLSVQLQKVEAMYLKDQRKSPGLSPEKAGKMGEGLQDPGGLPSPWLFPALKVYTGPGSEVPVRGHMHESALQKALKRTIARCGIRGSGSPHSFRHSRAAHLFDGGRSIHSIQNLMALSKLETTLLYAYAARRNPFSQSLHPGPNKQPIPGRV